VKVNGCELDDLELRSGPDSPSIKLETDPNSCDKVVELQMYNFRNDLFSCNASLKKNATKDLISY